MAKLEISQDVLTPLFDLITNTRQSNGKFYLSLDTSGQKYARIVAEDWGARRSYGFIVITDTDPKFKFGDILKAASWKAPAKNFARGNIFDPKSYAHFYWRDL